MIEEIRSAFDNPEKLELLDIEDFDEETLYYFLQQVERVASKWQNPTHRAAMSKALECVPLLELMPHMSFREEVEVSRDHQAFVVTLFGYRRGLLCAPALTIHEQYESDVFQRLCAVRGIHIQGGVDAYVYINDWISQWEFEHSITQHDLIVLRRTGWGDVILPDYIDLPFAFNKQKQCSFYAFKKDDTMMFDFESLELSEQDAAWHNFIATRQKRSSEREIFREMYPVAALYGAPPIEFSEASMNAPPPDPTSLRNQLPEGRSRSLLGRLMDWWSS